MKWEQIYKVDQELFTSYLEGQGTLKVLGASYKYISGETYFSFKEVEKFRQKIALYPLKLIPQIMENLKNVSDQLVNYSRKVSQLSIESKSTKELISLFKSFCQYYEKLLGLAATPLFAGAILEERINNLLKKYYFSDKERYEIFVNLSSLVKDTEPFKEKRDLYQIAKEIKKRKLENIFDLSSKEIGKILAKKAPQILKRILSHLEKWAYITVHILTGEGKTFESLCQEIKEILKKENPEKMLLSLLKRKREIKNKFNKTLKKIGNSEIKKLVNLLQETIFMRDYRFQAVCKAGFLVRPLINAIAQKFDCQYQDIYYLTPKEVIRFLQNGPPKNFKKIIFDRKKDYGILITKKRTKIYVNEELAKIKRKSKQQLAKIEQIKGIVANPGKVTGKVVIVENVDQLSKVKPKDILVTQQTTPGFVPILKKVSAIVTDLGGVTCHAAIVSRELKIPCIIGTKIATTVLKDGDLVEVDANKGIVRILKTI
jgi:phosphohistidine swiveling domain-containing protein